MKSVSEKDYRGVCTVEECAIWKFKVQREKHIGYREESTGKECIGKIVLGKRVKRNAYYIGGGRCIRESGSVHMKLYIMGECTE